MASDNLQQVLEGYEQEHIQLDVKFLNQALVAATLNDNYECIGKLIKMGARNIDECIQLGKKEGVTNAMAMLLLMREALTGNDSFLKRLLNPSLSVSTLDKLSNNSEFSLALPCQAVKIVSDGRLSTIDALEVAQKSGQHSVHRKLMMLTRVNMDAGSVDWSKLNLLDMDTKLFKACNWLVDLDLSANKLNSVPSEIGMLNKVRFNIILIVCIVSYYNYAHESHIRSMQCKGRSITHAPHYTLPVHQLTSIPLS